MKIVIYSYVCKPGYNLSRSLGSLHIISLKGFKIFLWIYFIRDCICCGLNTPESQAALKLTEASGPLSALCSTFSPVINSDSIGPGWMKGHRTGRCRSKASRRIGPMSVPVHPRPRPPLEPQTFGPVTRLEGPGGLLLTPRDGRGVRAGEKQGGKGERAVAVNEGQAVSLLLYTQQEGHNAWWEWWLYNVRGGCFYSWKLQTC